MRRTVSILDGNTFLVSDERGDVDPRPDLPTGLFSYDTRFLSTWRLLVDGRRLHGLSKEDVQYFENRFLLVLDEPTQYLDAKVSVLRHRVIGHSFVEDVKIMNHTDDRLVLRVRMEAGSDFADLFEVKNPQPKRAEVQVFTEDDTLRLSYRRANFHRETLVSSSVPAFVDNAGLSFTVQVEPQGSWSTRFHVRTQVFGAHRRDFRETTAVGHPRPGHELRRDLEEWLADAPALECADAGLARTYRRSLVDLAALRYRAITLNADVVAAGLPWFMTLFGRDSIITCLQLLPFKPGIVAGTLQALALSQGVRRSDFHDEEPGKILHELRYGESAGFEEQPHSPYYGAADTTPLFVVLLDEYERWTGDGDLVGALEFEARGALDWIDRYGDLQGTGYVWYQTRNPGTGLPNQCWKDSGDSVSFADGSFPDFPRALCEIQGYAYDAKVRGARLARRFWNDDAYADRLESEAAALKDRFNRDFWIPRDEFFALALDAGGRQVDSLTSNIGHLLWSGIVDDRYAPAVARHLLGERLFSGWGVRTLAEGSGRFNPLGYHVGTVWPFDNSLIAWGLRRYGFHAQAATVCHAMLEAADFFLGRLPEAFAGFARAQTTYPVEYPTACSPQAWSAGTPLLLLRVLLGLDPHEEGLGVDPCVPPELGRIVLRGVPGRWGSADAHGTGAAASAP
ncbi:amylo-alpha-1,6-glucosidase [Micromonospora marina]|uniref:amylo-alpha-1,6-glucosidase n=1 Tax=Micromonospora marina TaxID=307120 RepID=UPI0034571543